MKTGKTKKTGKTEVVRADRALVAQLREVARCVAGGNVKALVDDAITLYLNVEAPVLMAKFAEARAILDRQERQPVRSEGAR